MPVCAVREFRAVRLRHACIRLCLVCVCVCSVARSSVPLKPSSAQLDPCPAVSVCVRVCVWRQKRSSTRRNAETSAENRTVAAAFKWNNRHFFKNGSVEPRRSAALGLHGCFEWTRRARIKERLSAPASWFGIFSANSERQTSNGKRSYCSPQEPDYFSSGNYFISGAHLAGPGECKDCGHLKSAWSCFGCKG